MNRPNTVSVDILDKEYQVACPPDEEAALAGAARYLDQHMRDIRSTGKVIGLERVAIMAALNSQLDEVLYQLRQLEIN